MIKANKLKPIQWQGPVCKRKKFIEKNKHETHLAPSSAKTHIKQFN